MTDLSSLRSQLNHHHSYHHIGHHSSGRNQYVVVDADDLENLKGLNLQSLWWNPIQAYRDFWKIKRDKKYDMSWQEIVTAAGFDHEEHEVVTDDGYTLGVWRIKNKDLKPGAPVVFLQHGLFASADHWIAHKPDMAPAFKFANAGYDVWLGNNRGNNHSRKTTKGGCNPNRNGKCFYDYSFQELGDHDLPAQVDFVLGKTGHQKLTYVGHSQGTSQMFYALAKNEDYLKDRINLFVAFAPVARLTNVENEGLKGVAYSRKLIIGGLHKMGVHALMTPNWHSLGDAACKVLPATCHLAEKILSTGNGSEYNDNDEEASFGSRFPQAASWKQIMHFTQLVQSSKFREFDYGVDKNRQKYGSEKPSVIDVSKISKVPIAMFVGKQDDLATTTDASWARDTIPAVQYYEEIDNCDHGTFMTGLDMSWMDSVLRQVEQHQQPQGMLQQLYHSLGGLF